MDDIGWVVVVGIIAVVVVVAVAIGPIFTIWALNTLFHLEIPVDFKHWVAVFWLLTVMGGFKYNTTKKQTAD